MMDSALINCLDRPVVIRGPDGRTWEIAPSGFRAETRALAVTTALVIGGMPLPVLEPIYATYLPAPRPKTWYLVPIEVAQVADRADLLLLPPEAQEEDGRIVCTRLVRAKTGP